MKHLVPASHDVAKIGGFYPCQNVGEKDVGNDHIVLAGEDWLITRDGSKPARDVGLLQNSRPMYATYGIGVRLIVSVQITGMDQQVGKGSVGRHHLTTGAGR